MRRKMPLSRLISTLFSVFVFLFSSTLFGQDDFSFQKLVNKFPPLVEMAKMASEEKVKFGIYGGTVRDLYLDHPFTAISDCDIIFDSSEKNFPHFRDRILEYSRKINGDFPHPDFHLDLAVMQNENKRQKLFHDEGITATKVGVLMDGTIIDPTHRGVADLRKKIFSYYPPDRKSIELHNLGRFTRDLVRFHSFERDPGTIDLLSASFKQLLDSSSPEGSKTYESAVNCKKILASGSRVLFHQIVTPIWNDTRYLHNDTNEKITKFFPFDMFFADILRCITQADDMKSMREVFSLVGVPAFLEKMGFSEESALIMNPLLSREDLFREFEYPGFKKSNLEGKENFLKLWEKTLRKYNYRTLFDMLASEFPKDSPEANYLGLRKKDFLNEKSWETLNPGDDYEEMILGFLDTDFNVKVLPRKKISNSLHWFLENYLPLGNITLESAEPKEFELAHPDSKCLFRGFSPEVLSIDRSAKHSFANLREYLDLQTGPEIRPLYFDPGTTYAFFMSDFGEAAKLAYQLGFKSIWKVNACGFSRRLRTLLAFNEASNRILFVEYGFSSEEQLINQQARFYFLCKDSLKKGDESVFVYRKDYDWFPDKTKFLDFISHQKEPISVFFAGFTTSLNRMLMDSQKIQIGDLSLVLGRLPSWSSKHGPMVLGLSGFGASYGSLPAKIAKILFDKGLKTLVFVGTGGGLKYSGERFEWSIPGNVCYAGNFIDRNSPPIEFSNRAKDLEIPSQYRSSIHATVRTPLCETCSWVDMMKESGIVSVDCELYYLVQTFLKFCKVGDSIYALINITDIPGTNSERFGKKGGINIENNPRQYEIVEKALRLILRDIIGKENATRAKNGKPNEILPRPLK
ncbi:MAG: hypothetical protein HQM08_05090 [Candidatus Riflebacteria bacterium]|nr:hypothetical protein [Candidatus Riflebacteria bacterium]